MTNDGIYADVMWDGCNEDDSELIESIQYEAARMVTGAMRGTSRSRLFKRNRLGGNEN